MLGLLHLDHNTAHGARLNDPTTMLDVEIPKDTPLFRASLSHLEHRSHLLSRSCKSTLISAQAVLDALETLRKVEGELLDDLARLDGLLGEEDGGDDPAVDLSGSGSGSKSGYGSVPGSIGGTGVVGDVKTWLSRRREEEKERLEGVLMRRLKGLKSHLKGRGVGNGVALAGFEVSLSSSLSAMSMAKASFLVWCSAQCSRVDLSGNLQIVLLCALPVPPPGKQPRFLIYYLSATRRLCRPPDLGQGVRPGEVRHSLPLPLGLSAYERGMPGPQGMFGCMDGRRRPG